MDRFRGEGVFFNKYLVANKIFGVFLAQQSLLFKRKFIYPAFCSEAEVVENNVEQNVSLYFLSNISHGFALRSLSKNFCCMILM